MPFLCSRQQTLQILRGMELKKEITDASDIFICVQNHANLNNPDHCVEEIKYVQVLAETNLFVALIPHEYHNIMLFCIIKFQAPICLNLLSILHKWMDKRNDDNLNWQIYFKLRHKPTISRYPNLVVYENTSDRNFVQNIFYLKIS